jgi:hypothetical protein
MIEKKFNPFIKCRNPTKIHTAKGDFIHRCGKCDLCRQSKADNYSMQLQREEGSHKWSFFITLTYDPEWLPLYEVVDNYAHHDIIHRVRNLNALKREKIVFSYDLPLRDVTLVPCFVRPKFKLGSDSVLGVYDVNSDEDEKDNSCIKSKLARQSSLASGLLAGKIKCREKTNNKKVHNIIRISNKIKYKYYIMY